MIWPDVQFVAQSTSWKSGNPVWQAGGKKETTETWWKYFACNEKGSRRLRCRYGIASFVRRTTSYPKLTFLGNWHQQIQQLSIPHICHLSYTTAIWGVEILHLKVRKFATKVASRQNSVNFHPRTQIMSCVKIMICMLNCESNYTLYKIACVRLHNL